MSQEEQIELMRGNQDLELLRTIFTTELARVCMGCVELVDAD